MFIRIPATTTEKAKLLFYYDRDVLFNDVSLMSNFMAKNLATKEGNSLTDEFSISDDERDLFGVCVQQTLPDIYESMVKITNAIDQAFDDNVTVNAGDIEGVDPGTYIMFYLQDNEAYNTNVLTMVDASLNNSLKQGVLREFYSIVLQADFFKVCGERFLGELFKLKQRLFQLKKKSVVINIS